MNDPPTWKNQFNDIFIENAEEEKFLLLLSRLRDTHLKHIRLGIRFILHNHRLVAIQRVRYRVLQSIQYGL